MLALCDIVLWRKPFVSVFILMLGTAIFYHCYVLNHSLISLFSGCCLVLTIFGGASGFMASTLNFRVPVDPLDFQLSDSDAQHFVSCLLNVVGAADGLFKAAASGSDLTLFFKVFSVLYIVSVLGRVFSGAVVAYLGLWSLFTIPLIVTKLLPESGECPITFCRRGKNKSPKKMKHIETDTLIAGKGF